jgi:hypothetical protein
MTNEIKKIYFNSNYKIEKIKCSNNVVYLSDFIYKSLDGIVYNMIIKNKGYRGDWHIIELLSDNKLYATDNLWYSDSYKNNTDINTKIIETEISYLKIKEKYSDKNINYINSLDYVNECDIDRIKIICEESIKNHLIMEEKEKEEKIKDDFKYNNLIRHILCRADNDMDLLKIISYPKNMDTQNKVYEVYHSTRSGGDCSEYFNNIDDAQKEFITRLMYTIMGEIEEDLEDCINNGKLDESLYRSLIMVEKKYLNKKLIEEAYKYDIIFVKCKRLNKYMKSKSLIGGKFYGPNFDDYIYIINEKHYEKLKKLFDFIDYNYLDNISKGEKICRDILNELYPNHTFSKIRPNWLLNINTNHPLELDLYNDKLKIALEYNGKQHYDYCKHFHKNEDDLKKQKHRDLLKNELCNKKGIKNITVSYTLDTYEKIKEYIKKELNIK